MISYLKFLVKSTNEHGIHSPFVFNFTTKCLYSKPRRSKNKAYDVLFKSIAYFKTKRLKILGNPDLEEHIKKGFHGVSLLGQVQDIVYIESNLLEEWNEILNKQDLHNDSMVIFNGIHLNKESSQNWSRIIELEKITASIDLYHCGLVFIRKEQAKQHFRIRI